MRSRFNYLFDPKKRKKEVEEEEEEDFLIMHVDENCERFLRIRTKKLKAQR